MLSDELKIWHPMIDLVNPIYLTWNEIKTLAEYEQQLAKERKLIQDAWVAASFTDLSEVVLHRYFSHHKKEILILLDRLESYKSLQIKSDRTELYNVFITELRELLKFLDSYFFSYLDEVNALEKTICKNDVSVNQVERLPLKLSVAELACLIKLFYEAGLFPASTVIEVIRFFAKYFQTKRRSQISTGNLSKEYYSISQKTAASCRDILEKMIKKIDHQFFPVWVICSLAIVSDLI